MCYSVANGHIRVIGAASGKTALLKGHTGTVLDLELSRLSADGECMLASVSTGGEVFVWRMQHSPEGELSSGVKASWRRAADVRDGHYRRVMWRKSAPDGAPGLVLVASDSVDSVQLTGSTSQGAAMVDLNEAPSFVRLYRGAGVTDAALTAEGKKLAVSLSRGAIEVVDSEGGAADRAVESSVTISEGSHRLFFLSSWTTSQSTLPTAVLVVCSIRADLSSFSLVHAFSRRTLSALVLNHPGHSLTSASLDPTSSFLLLSHTSPDRAEHGLVAVHIRKGRDIHLEDARFDYLTPISTSSAVVSFCLTNDGPKGPASAVAWDEKTVDEVQLHCCCTKPIVQFHMRTDAIMRRVEERELMEEKYPEPAMPPPSPAPDANLRPQPQSSEETSTAPASGPGLLTPQAIRAASATSSPSSSPSSFPSASSASHGSPTGGRMSITLTSAPSPPSSSSAPSASSAAAALTTPLKILQRPPAINSAVLPISTGSPSSSPTTSHHAAASLVSSTRGSPEVPEIPASSPNVGTLQPQAHLSKLTQQPGVLTFPSLSAAAGSPSSVLGSRKDGPSEQSSLPKTPPKTPPTEERKMHHHATKRRDKEEHTRAAAADEAAASEADASIASEESSVGKERRRDTQEANLLARLDKLFARHFTKVSAMVQAQVERTLTSSREEMEKDRKERGGVEKQRTEGLLKVVTQSLQGPSGGTAQAAQQVETAVEKALARSFSQTLIPQLNSAIASALSSSSLPAPDVDVEALSSLVVQSLRSPLQEAFKATFSSVLLPGFEASTRAMFKQIEHVYNRMSESNEAMLREKVEDILQQRMPATDDRGQQQQQRQDELKEIHIALASLVQSNQALQRSITAMQQHQEQQHSTILELRALLQQPHAPSAPPSGAAAPPKAPTAAAPPPSDYRTELGLLLQQRQYEAAFTRALSLGKVPPVTWLCSQLDPIPLLHPANPAHRLSPAVLLSLIQQLGFNLKDEVELKLGWIKECLVVLDRTDHIIRPHVPDVLRGVLGRVEEQLNGAWKEPANKQLGTQGRTVQHLITAMLEQM